MISRRTTPHAIAFGIATLLLCAEARAQVSTPTPTMQGTWAQRIVTTSVSKLPVVGNVENSSYFYAITELAQNGEALTLTTTPCWVRMDSEIPRVKTVIPSAMVEAMGPRVRRGTIEGSTVHFPSSVDVLGARLENEWRGTLPDDPSDARVFDEDGDGHPGVTVRLFGPVDGSIYVAQRSWNELRGKIADDGQSVRGEVRWSTEQHVLGSTSFWLSSSPSVEPRLRDSHFELRKVSERTSCADLKQSYRTLFDG